MQPRLPRLQSLLVLRTHAVCCPWLNYSACHSLSNCIPLRSLRTLRLEAAFVNPEILNRTVRRVRRENVAFLYSAPAFCNSSFIPAQLWRLEASGVQAPRQCVSKLTA